MKAIVKSFEVGGQTITVETGKLAKQSDGAVVVKVGNTMLLATVVSSIGAREGVDFLPLSLIIKRNTLPLANTQVVSLSVKSVFLIMKYW
jgi:polyribonucleotide nucleotidyltransferase